MKAKIVRNLVAYWSAQPWWRRDLQANTLADVDPRHDRQDTKRDQDRDGAWADRFRGTVLPKFCRQLGRNSLGCFWGLLVAPRGRSVQLPRGRCRPWIRSTNLFRSRCPPAASRTASPGRVGRWNSRFGPGEGDPPRPHQQVQWSTQGLRPPRGLWMPSKRNDDSLRGQAA